MTSDIVMLKLKTPLTLNDYVQKICLPPPGFRADLDIEETEDRKVNHEHLVETNQSESPVCLVSGWGKTEKRLGSAQLKQATLPVIPSVYCNSVRKHTS